MNRFVGHAWIQNCIRAHHHISIWGDKNTEDIEWLSITLNIKKFLRARWNFKKRTLEITDEKISLFNKEKCLQLPWIEPDLSNYDKLVSKIKTYIILS